jgi:FtsZ-interacting cell division protein YlmF
MATTGSNAKRYQNATEAKATLASSRTTSIRLVPDIAPANLISELNAGLKYYVANVQGAIIEELENLKTNILNVWTGGNQPGKYNQRTIKKLVNSAISPGFSGFERTRDAISSIGEINPKTVISSFEFMQRDSEDEIETTVTIKESTGAKCKNCEKTIKKNSTSIIELGGMSMNIPTGDTWHIECFAAGILRDQAKKFRSAKGALDKQAIAVRGILEANKQNSILKGKKEGLQDIGTSVKYENWLNTLFENWSQTTGVKEEFRSSYQSAFNEYANAIVEYSNTGNFPLQATKDRLIKHLSKSVVESVLQRALDNDRELRSSGPDSSKPITQKNMEYLGLTDGGQDEAPRVITIDAQSYADAPSVAEAFRAGSPVILNCTSLVEDDRKRIIDFASGLVFGNGGTIERVTNAVFLLTPRDVIVKEESNSSNFV